MYNSLSRSDSGQCNLRSSSTVRPCNADSLNSVYYAKETESKKIILSIWAVEGHFMNLYNISRFGSARIGLSCRGISILGIPAKSDRVSGAEPLRLDGVCFDRRPTRTSFPGD